MAWPYSDNVRWNIGLEGRETYDDQPVIADTLVLAGTPIGKSAANGYARPCVAGDKFMGFAVRSADNRVASASRPDLFNFQNYGSGAADVNAAKVRLLSGGRLQLDKPRTPDTAGTIGNGITGAAGDQTDEGLVVYYNGSGFTNVAGGNTKVGTVVEVKLSNSGSVIWEIELQSDAIRTA